MREHGSGNAGATNTWRVLGWKAGVTVLLLDISKGAAASFLPLIYSSITSDPELLLWERVLCGIAAATGHIFPVFAGFRGGKAVATLLGVVLAIMHLPALCALGVFVIMFLVTRIVSAGSILAGISLPVFVWFLSDRPISLVLFSVLISILVIITHRKNISRLLKGEENKIVPGGKKSLQGQARIPDSDRPEPL